MNGPFLQLKNITKTFPGVRALENITLDIFKGEIHVIVGENGAGKSTLIKILTGVHSFDSGELIVDGTPVTELTPQYALRNLGIVPIYQELNLIPHLDVAENIFLGREILSNSTFGIIDRKTMLARTREILAQLGQRIEPTTPIARLGVGKQQMVEIAKALAVDGSLIILDEPTASLGREEIDELFTVMRSLKRRGVTLIFISHKLDEAKEIGDRLTVLRDGQKIITKDVHEVSEDEIIGYMVGRQIENKFPKINTKKRAEALRVENLSTDDLLRKVSFTAYRGEVLGIAGLVGSGRTELARAVIGADKRASGIIYINGSKVDVQTPEDALRNGLVLLTEDRKDQGLFLSNTVLFNCTIANLKKYRKRGFLDLAKKKLDTTDLVKKLQIKTSSVFTHVLNLSGGNQQKVVIGKWLNTEANIFIFDEPTRGIDVGAKVEVYNIINQLIKDGAAVIIISSELPEILGMSDRILVLCEGKVTGHFTREQATQEKIMVAATGGMDDAS